MNDENLNIVLMSIYGILLSFYVNYQLFRKNNLHNLMNITQLQKQIQILTDQINDIFHATELNFDAIKIHLEIEDQSQIKNGQKQSTLMKNNLVNQCEKQFKDLKYTYQQRNNLRLQYLINEQIKSEQQKVRRQRLLEYEDKIYDHRRLICDKESFYDSLLKPKIKRPPGLTNQQFQDLRYKQVQTEQRNNFQQLEEETQLLLKLQKMFRNHRILLEDQFKKYQKQVEQEKNDEGNFQETIQNQIKVQNQSKKIKQESTSKQQRQKLVSLVNATPTFDPDYQIDTSGLKSKDVFDQSKKLLNEYFSLVEDDKQLIKEYKQQRQMYKYLKWQQKDLIKKYKKLQNQIEGLRQNSKKQKRQKSL